MSCAGACFEITIPCCESVELTAGLEAGKAYVASVSRPGSKKVYKREIVTTGTGAIPLDKDEFPKGFFGYGYIELELLGGDNFDQPVEFTIDAKTAKCLLLEIADIDE